MLCHIMSLPHCCFKFCCLPPWWSLSLIQAAIEAEIQFKLPSDCGTKPAVCMLSPRGSGGVSEMRNGLAAGDSHEECVWKQGWYEGRVIAVCYIMKGLIYGLLGNHSKEQNCPWDPELLFSLGAYVWLTVSRCWWNSDVLLSRLWNVILFYVMWS